MTGARRTVRLLAGLAAVAAVLGGAWIARRAAADPAVGPGPGTDGGVPAHPSAPTVIPCTTGRRTVYVALDPAASPGSWSIWRRRPTEAELGARSPSPADDKNLLLAGAIADASSQGADGVRQIACTSGRVVMRFADGWSLGLVLRRRHRWLTLDRESRHRIARLIAKPGRTPALLAERHTRLAQLTVAAPNGRPHLRLDRRVRLDEAEQLLAADELDAADLRLATLRNPVPSGWRFGSPRMLCDCAPDTPGPTWDASLGALWHTECWGFWGDYHLPFAPRRVARAVLARRRALRPFTIVRDVDLEWLDDPSDETPWDSHAPGSPYGLFWVGSRFCLVTHRKSRRHPHASRMYCYDVHTGRWRSSWRRDDAGPISNVHLDRFGNPPPGACLGAHCELVIDPVGRIRWKGDDRISWNLLRDEGLRPQSWTGCIPRVRAWLPSPDRHWVVYSSDAALSLAEVRVTRKRPPPPKK